MDEAKKSKPYDLEQRTFQFARRSAQASRAPHPLENLFIGLWSLFVICLLGFRERGVGPSYVIEMTVKAA